MIANPKILMIEGLLKKPLRFFFDIAFDYLLPSTFITPGKLLALTRLS